MIARVPDEAPFVLARQPRNLKALVRRMLALEPLERYEKALEDARTVLRHCPAEEYEEQQPSPQRRRPHG